MLETNTGTIQSPLIQSARGHEGFENQPNNLQGVLEQINLPQNPYERAKTIANFSADDLVALTAVVHQAVAHEADPNPTAERMKMKSPDGTVTRELMDPKDRFTYFELASSLFSELGQQLEPGKETDYLARVGNILALGVLDAHAFGDGNGRTARVLAHLVREGVTDESKPDLALLGKNRPTEGFKITSFIPRSGDSTPADYLRQVAAPDIALGATSEYQNRTKKLFVSPYPNADSQQSLEHPIARQNLQKLRSILQKELDDSYMPIKFGAERIGDVAAGLLALEDPSVEKDVWEIIEQNSLDGVELSPIFGKSAAGDKRHKQAVLLTIYKQNPETARLLVHENIGGFHGSRSGSLWGVLQHDGLLSAQEARGRGQILSTGERTFSSQNGQASISFGDWREPKTINRYAGAKGQRVSIEQLQQEAAMTESSLNKSLTNWGEDHPFTYNSKLQLQDLQEQIKLIIAHPDSIEAELILDNFPITYGITINGFDRVETENQLPKDDPIKNTILERVRSDIEGEFMVIDQKISLDSLPVVAVPQDQINRVQELFKQHNKQIAVIDIALLTDTKKA